MTFECRLKKGMPIGIPCGGLLDFGKAAKPTRQTMVRAILNASRKS